MKNKEIVKNKLGLVVELANKSDAFGVYNALKHNLIEVKDVDEIPKDRRKYLEDHGFLRKEVEVDYYQELITNVNTDIYIARINDKTIVGFASIHKNQYKIHKLRSTLKNLYVDDNKTIDLLTKEDREFVYLDQVSILPEYQRKGVATSIMSKILADLKVPIVSFIVEVPLANKASEYWHEYNGFDLMGTADGGYKGKKFQWRIYIHWNKIN